MNEQQHNGDTVTNDSNRLLYLLVGVAITNVASLAGGTSLPQDTTLSTVLFILFAGSYFAIPILGYRSLKRVRASGVWDPHFRGALWILGFLIPLASPSFVVAYLFRHHERLRVEGEWERWVWVSGGAVAILSLCFILVGTVIGDPAVEGNTPLENAVLILFLSVSLVPGFATYYDVSYLRQSSGGQVSRFAYLWAPAMLVPFLQMGLFIGYFFWRRRVSGLKERIETVESKCDTARKRLESGEGAIDVGQYVNARSAFEDAANILDTVRSTINDIDASTAERPPQLEQVVQSCEALESSVNRQQSRAAGLQSLEEGEQKYENGDYEAALTALQDATEQLESALDDDADCSDEIRESLERAANKYDAVLDQLQSEELDPVSDQIESAYAAGCEALEKEQFDAAIAKFETTKDKISEFQDLTSEYDLNHEPPVEPATVDEKITAVKRQHVNSQADAIEDDLETAADHLEHDDHSSANTVLEGLDSSLTDLRSNASEHGFSELETRCDELANRHQSLLEAVEHQAPTDIGFEMPDLSIEYDAINRGETIGSGGNADVYRAELDTERGTVDLAIKEPRMSGTLHTDTIEKILAEAETWEKLDDHDHIVDIIDYGSAPVPWIAMEYMDAGQLDDRAGELPVDQALWTAVSITKAVRHAHRRGIAHLDLKPENVLFRSAPDGWDLPKVADWGLSKQLLDHSKSIDGLSPKYAAPEQFDDDYGVPDDITDIYQLGAVFYELFTGQPPFEGKPASVMNQVLTEQPAPPSEVAAVPPELDEVLLTAMAKEKADRFEDVILLRNALQEI